MTIKNQKTGHDLNMDSRLMDSYIKQKVLDLKDQAAYLKSLEDVSHKIKIIDPPAEDQEAESD